jgi:putative transcriptional regulator
VAERLRNRLRQLRSERNLTQAELAGLAGVSRKTINTVENGIFIPSTLLALKLARVLDLRVEDIFEVE